MDSAEMQLSELPPVTRYDHDFDGTWEAEEGAYVYYDDYATLRARLETAEKERDEARKEYSEYRTEAQEQYEKDAQSIESMRNDLELNRQFSQDVIFDRDAEIVTLESQLAAERKRAEWISCKDRLPEQMEGGVMASEAVLTCNEIPHPLLGVRMEVSRYCYGSGENAFSYWASRDFVPTHWMPLPYAPISPQQEGQEQ